MRSSLNVIKEKRIMNAILATLLLLASTAVAADTPRVYIEASETVDASNSKDKAKHVDFGAALAAALVKKEVPVTVVTDVTKSQWTIRSISSQREDSTGTKVAKLAFGGWGGGFTKFEGTIQVIDNQTSAVLYAYNVKKGNFQSAAEAFAKHFKSDYLLKSTSKR
jgi:polyisoprenoid-binding protein YceI